MTARLNDLTFEQIQQQREALKQTKAARPGKCRQCGKPFQKTRYWQSFCSSLCRQQWHKGITKEEFLALISELDALRERNAQLRQRIEDLEDALWENRTVNPAPEGIDTLAQK